jgi:hypothetical protein
MTPGDVIEAHIAAAGGRAVGRRNREPRVQPVRTRPRRLPDLAASAPARPRLVVNAASARLARYSGVACCSMYCLMTDSGAPPHEMAQ